MGGSWAGGAVGQRAALRHVARTHCCWRLCRAALVAIALVSHLPRAAGERHVAAGATHVCVIQDGGVAACYGAPTEDGKLNVTAGVAFHAVTAGDDFSCGLAMNGSLLCWGALPGTQPPPSIFFIDAHAGPRHVCGLQPNGTVRCYGDSVSGATAVPAGVAFQGVTAGTNYTCGVTRNHTVACWGGSGSPVVSNAAYVGAIVDAEHVACGADHACYIRVDGSVRCWGANVYGQATPPAALATNARVWWLAAGSGMTCAMSGATAPAAVVCWGRLSGAILTTAFQVACTSWGCVASSVGSGGPSSIVSAVLLPAAGGSPPPRVANAPAAREAVVTTLAGRSYGCSDGIGTAAKFNQPSGITVAPDGSLYVADTGNHIIRRVEPWTTVVTTVAGVCGSAGRNISAGALPSTFNAPFGVEADLAGNVYVADTGNHAIRMLSGEWVAGSTSGSPGSTDGVGTNASFNSPYGLRADAASGALYVADHQNWKVRAINATTCSVYTLASVGYWVSGIALNASGRFLYVGMNFHVKKVTYGGTVSPVAGGGGGGYSDGTGTAAAFYIIRGIVLDATGNLYATDYSNHRIRKVTPGGVVTTVAGDGTAGLVDGIGTAARLYFPWGIAIDGIGTLYVANSGNYAIRQVTVQQTPTTVGVAAAPLPPSPLAAGNQLTAWRALAASENGTLSGPGVDARLVSFASPLAAVNTAALNPAVRTLLLGNVTLVARDPNAAAAAVTSFNATFSSSAQRGLAALTLTTAAIPANSLALPAVTSLSLSSPAGSLALSPRSFAGLPALSCINCRTGSAVGLANLSTLCGSLTILPATTIFAIPGITALDVSANALAAVNEHDFDGAVYLRTLSMARNNISYVDDAAFSYAKHPILASIDQSANPLVAVGRGCRPTYFPSSRSLCLSAYLVCTTCTAGNFCTGSGRPASCPAGAYCPAGAAGATPCPAGYYCPPSAAAAIPCPPSFYCPAGSAAANLSCPVGSFCPLGSSAPPPFLGVAPTATSLQAAAAVVLLPPLAAASALVNITVAGTALCAGTSPRLTAMVVGGVPCAAVACPAAPGNITASSGSLATCVGWNASAAAAGILATTNTQVQLNVSAIWAAVSPPQSLRCEACVPAFTRPSLVSIVPPIIAAVGVPVVISGTGFMDASATPPTVLVGGVPCASVSALKNDVVRCATPAVLPSTAGFPIVSVVVVNAAGAASAEGVTLTYPAAFTASWAPASLARTIIALPGAPLAPPPVLSVLSREAAACSLTVNASACTNGDAALLARPVSMAVQASAHTPLAVGSSGSLAPSSTALLLDALTVSGASGCSGTLVATCIDITGNTATTAGQPGPPVALAAWSAAWNHTLRSPLVLAPEPLPALNASFQLVDASGGPAAAAAAAGYLNLSTAADSFLSCLAVLLPAAAGAPALDTPLERLSPRNVLSSAAGTLHGAGTSTSLFVTFAGLTASAAQLGQALAVYAECAWTPTGERVRLPPVPATVIPLQLAWVAPPRIVLGYTPLTLGVTLTNTDAIGERASAAVAAACEVRLLNATVRSAALVTDSWSFALDPASPAGTALPAATNVTLQAPPGTVAFLQAACEVWGQMLLSLPLRLAAASLTLRAVSQLPTSFIASDASSPWPLEPPLALAVATVETGEAVADVTCAVTTPTPGAVLVVVDATTTLTSLLSIPAHPMTGVVAVPRFLVSTSPSTPAVTFIATCRRVASGDAAPALTFDVPAVQLRAARCTTPQSTAAVGVALAPFAVGIDTTVGGFTASACEAATATANAPSLPPIACIIALNASATTTNDTASIFLQHSIATVAPQSHRATFDAFTLVAPQGETFGLTATCSVGGLAIPPTLPFSVTLRGCAPGQQSVSVTCVTCGGGTFSQGGMGARCRGCPPAGASCDAGILTLRRNFFRPVSQAGAPLGPDTELHPCYNAEACTLTPPGNGSDEAVYGCAPGYTGALCGVCDAGANYARFGEVCATCWSPGASWLFLLVVLAFVGAALTRVALRTDTSRSDASIVLRIALGYLQAVGSLRVFRAGSTQAYGNVMGWTEVVSASPLSVGALQCILWLPYLVQYVVTVVLPLLAAVAVSAIFLSVSAARATHCRPRCSLDAPALRSTVRAWMASKRHLSTLLFVMFLTYMPIISASLRALDCVPPIAGLRYLRSDLGVECGVGQHAAARALAYTVLVVVGFGFPAGLAWLLGTATTDQLLDDGFHATWGFLFDGYRAPLRTLVAAGAPAAMPPAGTGTGGAKPTSLFNPMASTQQRAPDAAATAAAGDGGRRPSRRRSSLLQAVPERMTQHWVVAGDSRVWWEAVVLARKAGVVLLAVTLTNPYLQCVGATLWFAGAAVLQARYSPYTKALFNRLEMATLAAAFLTAVVSTTLLQFNVGVSSADLHAPDAMTGLEWAVTILLVLINLGTFAALAGLWLRLQCRRARGIMRRVSMASAMGGRVAAMRTSLAARRRSSAKAPAGDALPDSEGQSATVNPLRTRASFHALPAARSDAAPDVALRAAVAAPRAAVDEAMPEATGTVLASAAATFATGASAAAAGGSAVDMRGVSFSAVPVMRSRRPAPRAGTGGGVSVLPNSGGDGAAAAAATARRPSTLAPDTSKGMDAIQRNS